MVGFQQDAGLTPSELKVDLHNMSSKLSLYLEAIHGTKGQHCRKKSCPCSKKFGFSDNFYLASPTEPIKHHASNLPESKACSTPPLFQIPLNLRSLEFSFERLKSHKTESMHDLGDFIFEYFMALGSGDAGFSPFKRRTNDFIENALKAMIVTNNSLFLNLRALDDDLRQFKVRSACPKGTEISELTCSPSQIGDSSLNELKVELNTYGKQVPELETHENLLVPCPRTSSTSSFQSDLSSHGAVSSGLLQCTWKSGVPCFVFMMNDDQGKVFTSYPHKIESSEDNTLDYIYFFHSRVRSKKSPRDYANYDPQLVGRMKVRSSFVFDLNNSKHIETEFVLCDTTKDHSRQMQTSSSSSINKVLSKKVSEIFKPSHSVKNKSTCNVGGPSFQYEELPQEPFCCGLCDFDGPNSKKYLEDKFPPNLELAAIVVNNYQCDSKKTPAKGGWGLKFLENFETCEESYQESSRQINRIMNVIIPAGLHGGPNSRPGGPSSLTERWRSGGHCECGGWDIGCPLKILQSTLPCIKSLPPELLDSSKSLDLSIEGLANGEPLLKMVSIDEGFYCICFSPALSALQSFSVGVAMIHSQTPSLYPKL